MAEDWGLVVSWDDCQTYGDSIKDWSAFADSVESLAYLKKHYKLVILSNIDNASFAHSNKRLAVSFDAVYTAQDIGSYKPSPRNFDYMLDKLNTIGIAKAQILHTAESLFHDHGPANRHGLASCWIFRRHDKQGFGATMDPGTMPKIDFRFISMADFVAAHRRELALNQFLARFIQRPPKMLMTTAPVMIAPPMKAAFPGTSPSSSQGHSGLMTASSITISDRVMAETERAPLA